MSVVNPEIGRRIFFDRVDWRPLLFAHKNKSSQVAVSSDYGYIKKTKKRRGRKRDAEYYNLAFWDVLLDIYNDKFQTQIFSPTPYLSKGRDIVMEFSKGVDLQRLFGSDTVASSDREKIILLLGKMFKIKDNEGLVHGDFLLRHVLAGEGLYVIDLERAQTGNEGNGSRDENDKLKSQIKGIHKDDYLESLLSDGYDMIPKIKLSDKVLQHITSLYGGRAEFYLKRRYRR